MKMKFSVIALGALVLAAVPMLAHHSFSAEYDQSKPLTLRGKFTKLDWVNPHSWVHFDVVGPDGKVTSWAAETPPPNGLYRNGWRKDMFKEGEEIEVRAMWPPRTVPPYVVERGDHRRHWRPVHHGFAAAKRRSIRRQG